MLTRHGVCQRISEEVNVTVDLILAARDVVGESLVWDDRRQCLAWVDIIGRRIQAFDPVTGSHEVWPLTQRPTSIGLCQDGGAIIGLERHICRWDWSGEPVPLVEVEPQQPFNRLNEGVVGPDGAFWVGTMQQNIGPNDEPLEIGEATGCIYRFDVGGQLRRASDDLFGITNTLVWPEPERLVTADTLANTLYAYRIGMDGRLSDRRVVLTGFSRGLPDGSTMDAEGFIWTARVAGGACLTRMTPDGCIDRVVDLSCSWPTSCAFGGDGLRTLYVTSARFTMTPEHLANHPHEGGLFALDAGVAGLPSRRFGAIS